MQRTNIVPIIELLHEKECLKIIFIFKDYIGWKILLILKIKSQINEQILVAYWW